MTDLRKAAEMALNALKISTPVYSPHKFTQALKALEAALAQPEFDTPESHIVKWSIPVDPNNFGEAVAQPVQEHIECGYDETVGMCTNNPCCEQAQPEQEPVAKHVCNLWINPETSFYEVDRCTHPINEVFPVYTAPPKREWVGLTDDEIDTYAQQHSFSPDKAPEWFTEVCRDIEAKLNEKNT